MAQQGEAPLLWIFHEERMLATGPLYQRNTILLYFQMYSECLNQAVCTLFVPADYWNMIRAVSILSILPGD